MRPGEPSDRLTTWTRWTARILGLGASGMWLLVFAGSAAADPSETISAEGIGLVALVAASSVGVVVALRYEAVGGVVAVAGGLALSAFAVLSAGRNEYIAVLVSGFPYLAAGVLYLISWHRTRRHHHQPGAGPGPPAQGDAISAGVDSGQAGKV